MLEQPLNTRRDNDIDATSKLLVNGEPYAFPTGSNVRELLRLLGLDGRRVAVAVNRAVVPKSRYDAVDLSAGDRVEILEAVGGG